MRTAWIILLVVVGLAGCKEEPSLCAACNQLPEEAAVFAGKWKWEYSVLESELSSDFPLVNDSVDSDTISQIVELLITETGSYNFIVGENCYEKCICPISYELRVDTLLASCVHGLRLEVVDNELNDGILLILECDDLDKLSSFAGGIPFGLNKNYLPLPTLLPGYKVVVVINHYTRVQ